MLLLLLLLLCCDWSVVSHCLAGRWHDVMPSQLFRAYHTRRLHLLSEHRDSRRVAAAGESLAQSHLHRSETSRRKYASRACERSGKILPLIAQLHLRESRSPRRSRSDDLPSSIAGGKMIPPPSVSHLTGGIFYRSHLLAFLDFYFFTIAIACARGAMKKQESPGTLAERP